MATIPVMFKWLSTETDPRAYKPGKPMLEPVNMVVQVDLPLKGEYIVNYRNDCYEATIMLNLP